MSLNSYSSLLDATSTKRKGKMQVVRLELLYVKVEGRQVSNLKFGKIGVHHFLVINEPPSVPWLLSTHIPLSLPHPILLDADALPEFRLASRNIENNYVEKKGLILLVT
jgi:hypothetical protein